VRRKRARTARLRFGTAPTVDLYLREQPQPLPQLHTGAHWQSSPQLQPALWARGLVDVRVWHWHLLVCSVFSMFRLQVIRAVCAFTPADAEGPPPLQRNFGPARMSRGGLPAGGVLLNFLEIRL
jgi:hypothetical protein